MARMLDLSRSWKWFLCYLALALVAFWPTYLSQPRASSLYTHFHALTATAFLVFGALASGAAVLYHRAHVRHVRRLLGETTARQVTLRISSEKLSVKGGTITGFNGRVTENNRHRELAFGQKLPDWLGPWFIETPIQVYGGGKWEPLVLADGERLHVVRWLDVGVA